MTRRISKVRECDVLVVDLIDVPKLDGSAALAMDDIISHALAGNQEVILVGLNFTVARLLAEIGTLDKLRETSRFESRGQAVRAALAEVERLTRP
jgi:SulP family sulfate permease